MKIAKSIAIVGSVSLLLVSSAMAQQTAAAPVAASQSARLSAWTKAQEEKLVKFRECLNNRPVEAEAYDCGYLLTAISKKIAKVVPKKAPPQPMQVAALK